MRCLKRLMLVGVAAAAALAPPTGAQGLNWSNVTVDATGSVGTYTSLAVDTDGDLVVSYYDATNTSLKVATCDLSASAYGRCNQPGDWSPATVDAAGSVGRYNSLAISANGDRAVSYYDTTNFDLKVAVCDLSASPGGNCDQPGDWTTVTVDAPGGVGEYTSIAAAANGDPMASYHDTTNKDLKFAICDVSASANGNCDQSADWTATTVDSTESVGRFTSILTDASGNPMISYNSDSSADLKFAVCEMAGSANGNCDQSNDWNITAVDSAGSVGDYTAIALDASRNAMISYRDLTNTDLKFAICDLSASVNGNCDRSSDWVTTTVDSAGAVGAYTSIAVGANGEPMISYHDSTNLDLKLAVCDMSTSAHGNCDESGDWSSETVDSTGRVGRLSSIAPDADGDPAITYSDDTNSDLKFASTSPGDADGDGFPDGVDGCPTTPTLWPTPFGDGDCDGFTDTEEASVGTDPSDACPDNLEDDAWPADMKSPEGYGQHDGEVSILDIVELTPPVFNTGPPDPNYSARKDLNGDDTINILDIVRLTPPMFNTSCTP